MQDTSDIDIHALLAERRKIAAIWSIEDVQFIRPDLSQNRAWEVLQEVEHRHNAELGITWQILELVADDLFSAPDTDTAQEAP